MTPSTIPSLLRHTPMLDYEHPRIQQLLRDKGWHALPVDQRIRAAYDFVRNDIPFGYNTTDNLPASLVLQDGLGQCNTKSTLLMALLRGLGVPCRLHGFTINKALQKGAITGVAYRLAPKNIVHSWVEVPLNGRWLELEGFILDAPYLRQLQRRFAPQKETFCGYGVATPDLHHPAVEFHGESTYIQKEGINQDLGVFDDPDQFYTQHGTNLSGVRRWLFEHLIRHQMNRNVASIRGAHVPAQH